MDRDAENFRSRLSGSVSSYQSLDSDVAKAIAMDDKKPCIWTTQSLFEHFTALREADIRERNAALQAMNYRLETMNEFRATVEDVQGKMLPRKEAWGFLAGAMGMVYGTITTGLLLWAAFHK